VDKNPINCRLSFARKKTIVHTAGCCTYAIALSDGLYWPINLS